VGEGGSVGVGEGGSVGVREGGSVGVVSDYLISGHLA